MIVHNNDCQLIEEKMEQDKKKVQSMAELMKNPTKIVLLQASCSVFCTNHLVYVCRIWLVLVRLTKIWNQKQQKNVASMVK